MPELLRNRSELVFNMTPLQENNIVEMAAGGPGDVYPHVVLSYTTKADPHEPEQQPRETLTCVKCGAKVRGERGLKIHNQQWCGQSAHEMQAASRPEDTTGTQGSERVKKWPCSCCFF